MKKGIIIFANERGLLAVTVPGGMVHWLRKKFGDAIVPRSEERLSLDGTAKIAKAWMRPRPGMRASFPPGALGEVGVEAG